MFKNKRLKYFLGSVLLLFLTITFVRQSFGVFKSKERLDDVNTDISNLEKKKGEIEKEIAFKKTPEYIEETARNDLNMVKPDEIVYVVVNGDGSNNSSNGVLSESDSRGDGVSSGGDVFMNKNWYSWYKLFFND